MRYLKKRDFPERERDRHPSIHHTGSVRGMKKLGYWGKHDDIVRCGQYIYNLSIVLSPSIVIGP